jgi:hypothetical protein
MKPQSSCRALEPCPHFEQPQPYGLDPCPAKRRLPQRMATKQNHELIGQPVQLQPQGIGSISVARPPVPQKVAFELLDVVFTLTAMVMPLKHLFGLSWTVGHHKTNIAAHRPHLNLDHHPPILAPTPGSMPKAINRLTASLVRAYLRWARSIQRAVFLLNTALVGMPMA